METTINQANQPGRMVHEFGFTLTDVFFQGFTTLASPQITPNVGSHNLKVAYKDEDANELTSILSRVKLEQDQDEVAN
ncbi:hypothetical protein [Parasitella parasitica]|uniref:Uncharacterized protein n=1 Tax=Parasitella parasitica TaxID=35722 RepID=A0A0B7NKI3_9FUNG|nr:hypothetical protein [Parasitella parasitica]